MTVQERGQQPHENIGIRYIEPHLQSKVTILIVDRKYSLAIELKDDTKPTSIEAIGLATCSNSQSTVLSYASIFESLWTQTELYQKFIACPELLFRHKLWLRCSTLRYNHKLTLYSYLSPQQQMLPLEYKLIQVFLFLRQTEGAGEFALKSLSDDHDAHFVMRSSYYYLTIVIGKK